MAGKITPQERQRRRAIEDAMDAFVEAASQCRKKDLEAAMKWAEKGRDALRQADKIAATPQQTAFE